MVYMISGIAFFICMAYTGVWCGDLGHDPGRRVTEDTSYNQLLLPDPDIPAPGQGYIYQIRLYSIKDSVDFTIKILRATGRHVGEYIVIASSDSNGAELTTTTRDDSETILVIPAPLPIHSGDVLAFFFPSEVPIGYAVENHCTPGSRYRYVEHQDPRVKQLVTLKEASGQHSCRIYSYVADYVSGVGQCINIYQGAGQSAGVLATPHYGSYFYEDNLDLCWHVTSDPDTTVIATLDYDLQHCCDFVEIFDGSTSQSPRLGKVSGRQTNRDFFSTGRHMYIRARSDANISNYNGMIAHIYTRGAVVQSSGSMLDTGTKVGLGIGFSVMIIIIIVLMTVFCLKYVHNHHRPSEHTPNNHMDVTEKIPPQPSDIYSDKSPPQHGNSDETNTSFKSTDCRNDRFSSSYSPVSSDINNVKYDYKRTGADTSVV